VIEKAYIIVQKRLFFKKRLHLIIIRARKEHKNLHIPKEYINFAPKFALFCSTNMKICLKIVNLQNRHSKTRKKDKREKDEILFIHR